MLSFIPEVLMLYYLANPHFIWAISEAKIFRQVEVQV